MPILSACPLTLTHWCMINPKFPLGSGIIHFHSVFTSIIRSAFVVGNYGNYAETQEQLYLKKTNKPVLKLLLGFGRLPV